MKASPRGRLTAADRVLGVGADILEAEVSIELCAVAGRLKYCCSGTSHAGDVECGKGDRRAESASARRFECDDAVQSGDVGGKMDLGSGDRLEFAYPTTNELRERSSRMSSAVSSKKRITAVEGGDQLAAITAA